ncbi:MAG: ornithine cyclodeaminase family protein, partial [Gaiellaceae bacterium]
GELLVGTAEGRTSAEELTVFKSLGLAVEDLAAAEHLYRRSRETGTGTEVDL